MRRPCFLFPKRSRKSLAAILAPFFFTCITSAQEPAGALSEERTWTSADGKTLSGYLVLTQSGNAKAVAANNAVTLLIDGKPFRLPLDRLSEQDQDYIKLLVAETNNAGFTTFPNVEFELTRREEATFFRQFSGLVFPSFAHPQVAISTVDLSNVMPLAESGAKATVTLSGDFHSALANKLAHADPQFPGGRVYLSGKEAPIAEISFELNPNRRKEPKDAEYSITVDNVEFAEGENVLVVAFPDPVTGLEGRDAFALEVAKPGGNPLIGNLQSLSASGPGDAYTYQLTAKDLSAANASSLRLCIGGLASYTECDLRSLPSDSNPVHLVAQQGSESPNSFCLLPSRAPYVEAEIREAFRRGSLLTLPEGVGDEFQFLVGFAHGVFLNGADVFTSDGEVVVRGASLSHAGTSLLLKAHWRDGESVGKPFTIPIPAGFREGTDLGLSEFSHPRVMWEIAKGIRGQSTDAAKVESLLEGAFDNAEEIPRSWILTLAESIREPLLLVHLEMSDKPALQHGFLVGATIAAAANRSMPPLDPAKAWEPPTPEELNEFVENFLDLASASGN